MTDVRLTDDDEQAEQLTLQTRAALALAGMIQGGPVERVAVLLAVAAALIEREVGVAMAPAALCALLEPVLARWQTPGPTDAQH